MNELIKPWSKEKRAHTQGKIDAQAAKAAKALKAECCMIVAFFPDGGFLHMQDGGKSPMPPDQLYRQLLSMREVMETSGSEDVAIQ
jgi:hypothetical protein